MRQYKPISSIIVALAITILASGCASQKVRQLDEQYKTGSTEYPDWYTDSPEDESPMVFYGVGESYAEPGLGNAMRRLAASNARADIAAQIQAITEVLQRDYTDLLRGSAAQTRVELRQLSQEWVNQTIVGARIVNSAATSDGRWLVQARLDLNDGIDGYLDALNVRNESERNAIRASATEFREQMLSQKKELEDQ